MNKVYITLLAFFPVWAFAQPAPSPAENIDFLVTFSPKAKMAWGDDDFHQVFFFAIPKDYRSSVYIRVFDPDLGGQNDQKNGTYDSETSFTIYGGPGAFSAKGAQSVQPNAGYTKGNVIATKKFKADNRYDNGWYTFGPFNPLEGEKVDEMGAHVFKCVIKGTSGDDGNLYKLFLSTNADRNQAVPAGNAFTYEYSFRPKQEKYGDMHLYPFIDQNVIAVKQHNFDVDNLGYIKVYSVAKNGHNGSCSKDGNWATSRHEIDPKEKGKSLDIRLVKQRSAKNDMVFYITNQYDQPVPMFAVPIGGIPRYQYATKIRRTN